MTDQETFAIRRLGPGDTGDAGALMALFARAFEDTETYADAPPGAAYHAGLLANPGHIVLVGKVAGVIAGGLVAYVLPKFERARSEVYIYDLAVDAAHRRKGLARALIGALKPVARDAGAWVIYVQADHGDPPAIALYDNLGTREDVLHFDISPD